MEARGLPTVVETADGSKTLFCSQYQQTYHSLHGALTESRHVFIEASGLADLVKAGSEVSILEIGFGTGLNYLLAAKLAEEHGARLNYHALERRILPVQLLSELNYGSLLAQQGHWRSLLTYLDELRNSSATVPFLYKNNSTLQIYPQVDSITDGSSEVFDVVFHDAFSPEQNPELWSNAFIASLCANLKSGGKLTTYTAKGDVRRAIQSAGLTIEKRLGPPGKRHMLVGLK